MQEMVSSKTTLVIGASLNVSRFSHTCVLSLVQHGIPVKAVGLHEGIIGETAVLKGMPVFQNIHTVTLYIGAQNQPSYYDYIISLTPERVIFNPGSENPEFEVLLRLAGIETIRTCTLMMLDYGDF